MKKFSNKVNTFSLFLIEVADWPDGGEVVSLAGDGRSPFMRSWLPHNIPIVL